MAIKKARKDELVEQYTDLLKNSSAIFLTQYSGMTVKDLEALRIKISDANGQINVTKNTLLRVAMEANEMTPPLDLLTGQTATLEGDGRTFADVARQRLGGADDPREEVEEAPLRRSVAASERPRRENRTRDRQGTAGAVGLGLRPDQSRM